MSAELWERTSFRNRELLSQDEDQIYEYKEYSYPVKDHLQESMRQVLCSYLNTKGGYLFIGISDSRHVVGIQMNPQQRDEFKRLVQTISTTFFPKVDMVHDPMIHVSYIPIKNQLGENLAGKFIIRVTVQQGDVSTFYTYQNPSKEIVGYERMDARKESYTYPKVMEQVQQYAKNPKIRAPRLKVVKPEEITDVLVPPPEPQQQVPVQPQQQQQKPRQIQQVESYLEQQRQVEFQRQKGNNKNKHQKGQKQPHNNNQQHVQNNQGFVQLPKLATKGKGRSKDQSVVDKHIQREIAKMQLEQQGSSVAEMVNQKLAKAASLIETVLDQDTYQVNEQNQLLNIKKFLLHHIDSVKKPIKTRILNTCAAIDEIFLTAEILEKVNQPKNTIIQSQFVIPNGKGGSDFQGSNSKKKRKNNNKYKQDLPEQLEKVEINQKPDQLDYQGLEEEDQSQQETPSPQQSPIEEEKFQPSKEVLNDVQGESDDAWEDEEEAENNQEEVEVEDGDWEDQE